jgi:hypothetical protein
MLEYGASGQLAVAGEIEVFSLDDEKILEKANPLTPEGKANAQERHDAQVQSALAEGPLAFIILGGDHDLSGSVRRLDRGKAEYIRLTTLRYQQFR